MMSKVVSLLVLWFCLQPVLNANPSRSYLNSSAFSDSLVVKVNLPAVDSTAVVEDSSVVSVSNGTAVGLNSPFLKGMFTENSMLFVNPNPNQFKVFNNWNAQPEVWSPLKPIGNGVDAQGDLGLQIPLMTVPGLNGLDYPITLSYQSGSTAQQPGGWVGLGWSFNSGSIVRDVQAYTAGSVANPNVYSVDFTTSTRTQPDQYIVGLPGSSFNMVKSFGSTPDMAALTNDIEVTGSNRCNGAFSLTEWSPWKVDCKQSSLGIHFDGGINSYEFVSDNAQLPRSQSVYRTGTYSAGSNPVLKNDYSSFVLTAPDGKRYVFGLALLGTYNADYGSVNLVEYYVHTWMLTAILGTDYIPSSPNKLVPDSNDKGSWMKLHYDVELQTAGGNGFDQQKRQVAFLNTVESPTHFARFHIDRQTYADFSSPYRFSPFEVQVKLPLLSGISLYKKNSNLHLSSLSNANQSLILSAALNIDDGFAGLDAIKTLKTSEGIVGAQRCVDKPTYSPIWSHSVHLIGFSEVDTVNHYFNVRLRFK